MFRKIVILAPIVGAFVLSTPAAFQVAQSATFSPTSATNITPLIEPVRDGGGRGGGGVIWRGGGGGGGGFGRGSSFRGSGLGGPSFRAGPSLSGRSNFRAGGFSGPGLRQVQGFSGRSNFRGFRAAGPGYSVRRLGEIGPGSRFRGYGIGRDRGPRFTGNVSHGRYGHHRHGRRFYWGSGFYFLSSDIGYGYYNDDCEWLRHRAEDTGSPYWARLYRICD